jgi:hypothetical protein
MTSLARLKTPADFDAKRFPFHEGTIRPRSIMLRPPGRRIAALLWEAETGEVMNLDIQVVSPAVALIAGILILLMPRLLNYVVAIYLIVIGLIGLSSHFH